MSPSSTRYRQAFGPRRERPKYLHMATGAMVAFTVYLLLHSALEGSTLVSIMIFNLLSVLLTFPLRGPLWCKMLWLGLGNLVGLAWNLIWLSLMAVTVGVIVFQIVYFAIGPAVDFLWIVPVWSLGLSALASVERRKRGEKEERQDDTDSHLEFHLHPSGFDYAGLPRSPLTFSHSPLSTTDVDSPTIHLTD
ncbi:hypothetical protein GWO13_10815 [Candidatus Bathyarchaeota archaeon]|nr:hypothetical protein [Candidatus Bathyarchaeota archaeon]